MFLAFESQGEGSGSIIDREGHVLTNFHVVEGANKVDVTLFDGNTYKAQLVGGDPSSDVAILKIDAPPESLFPVTFGSSSNLLVGQRVFAIGNPFGLERTLSTGIISSLDRSLPGRRGPRPMKSIIQIDAAINPGSSGGPLLDSHGRMIGMNTAIASKTGESVGVGFAIPVNTICANYASTDPERPGTTSRRRHRQSPSNRARAVDCLDDARRAGTACRTSGPSDRRETAASGPVRRQVSDGPIGPPPT